MIRKLSEKQSLKPTLNDEQLQNLVAKLTEQSQATISGGGFKFPCDGPGRGGTCVISVGNSVFLISD